MLPLVLIPTTAGTGSEVSGGAVITNEETHIKAGIASPNMRGQHALVDPVLTYGLPRTPTRDAGVDALAQAIAAIAVTARTPIGNGIGLEAIRMAADALPAVCADGSDHAARQQMACVSLMGGLVMNISDCGSEHSIAQALGGAFGIPHGLTIGLVLAESMDHDRHAVPELFDRIADALGEPQDGTADGSRAVRAVRRILREVDFPVLSSIGVTEDQLEGLAANAMQELLHQRRPEPVDAGRRRPLLPGGARHHGALSPEGVCNGCAPPPRAPCQLRPNPSPKASITQIRCLAPNLSPRHDPARGCVNSGAIRAPARRIVRQ